MDCCEMIWTSLWAPMRGRRFALTVLVWCLPVVAIASSAAAEPRRLTDDGLRKLAPTFAKGGEEIVYSVHDVPNRVSLVRLKLADGSREPLFPTLTDHQFDAAVSYDGRYLCFAKSQSSPQLVLVIRDLQAEKERVFRPEGARSTVRTPRFYRNGNRVVFTLSAPGGQQIASVDIEGEDLQRLTQSPGTNCWPTLSPDGERIVFCSSRFGNFDLYVMNTDGSSVRRLTETPFREMRPAWSPDGQRIALTSIRDGNHEIYTIHPDGSHLRRITDHPERDDFATWHPNGAQLLTVSVRAGRYDLYLHDVAD